MDKQTQNNLIADTMLKNRPCAVVRDNYGEVSRYGWDDWGMFQHVYDGKCSLSRNGDVETWDDTYSVFEGTFVGMSSEYGINAKGINGGSIDCSCGKYRDLEIRYVGSFSDILLTVLDGLDL